MTAKAGQKCTAIRRIIVPQSQVDAVSRALIARLESGGGRPGAGEGVKMGALVNAEQRADVQEKVDQLIAAGCRLVWAESGFAGRGAFFPPTLLFCPQPDETPAVHATEAFGPVATLMPYRNAEHAMQLGPRGGGIAGTLVTADSAIARQLSSAPRAPTGVFRSSTRSLKESTGHGSPAAAGARRPWPRGRRRRAGRPARGETLPAAHRDSGQPDDAGRHWQTVGARRAGAGRPRHPFRKYFEELQPGDSLLTPRRTLTEADIVNFACLSGDHFYAIWTRSVRRSRFSASAWSTVIS
jgi:oxepin-CoA hydrolase/3-oxo-5,6-dehydrosuberyl-CoA semialdehyde dehydrogenase